MLSSYSFNKVLLMVSLASVSGMLDHITQHQGISSEGLEHLMISNDADQHIVLINPEPVFDIKLTMLPSNSPTENPIYSPTVPPSINHSNFPSIKHSASPTIALSNKPSTSPTESPTRSPTIKHSLLPTAMHSNTSSSLPIDSPTKSPTVHQSLLPTIIHSSTPSSSPIDSPTKSPTVHQSLLPTIIHSSTPSSSPIDSPTKSPTLHQSLLPTIKPSDQSPTTIKTPTAPPSAHPTILPSEISDKCNIVNGETFGETSTNRETILYFYEVETKDSPNLSEILQSLENTIGNSILKELYSGCNNQRSLKNTMSRRKLGMTGLTSNPSDRVTSGTCSNPPSSGNSCVLVEGRMWIYFDSSGDDPNERAQIVNIIKEGMESCTLAEVDSSIVRVTYVDAPKLTNQELTPQGSTTSAQPAKGSVESRYIILMSFSVVAVAMGVVATRKYVNRNNDLNSSNVSDPDNSGIMNPLSPTHEYSQQYSDGDSEMGSTSIIMSETTESSEFNDTSIIYDHRRKKTFDFGDVTIEEVDLDDDIEENDSRMQVV